MDLQTVLSSFKPGPGLSQASQMTQQRPQLPTLRLKAVSTREVEKVREWDFTCTDNIKPLKTFSNLDVAFTDGQTISKMTVFEKKNRRVKEGETYMVKNYQVGENVLQCWATTAFFKTTPMSDVSSEVEQRCRELLCPPSQQTAVGSLVVQPGLFDVQGFINVRLPLLYCIAYYTP